MNIPNITGRLREIEYYIHNLMSGDNDTAFLVIEISGTEDFIQFLKDEKGVQLDFPLVTDRQKQLEERVRQEALEQNLELLENNGTDGQKNVLLNVNAYSYILRYPDEAARCVSARTERFVYETK